MSNPLAQIRKHQKILLAVFGVAIIFAFVLGTGLQKMLDNAGGPSNRNKVALTWVEGDISVGQLGQMADSYRDLTRFLQNTEQKTVNMGGRPRAAALRSRIPQNAERMAVRNMLLAKKADSLGIVVSDKVIIDYITRWTDNSLDDKALEKIRDDARMSEKQLFAILRRELKAQKLLDLASFADDAGTPAQLYAYAGRLHRPATFEFLPIHVVQFVDHQDNPDPSDAKLQDFYKLWKDESKSPGSPLPGMKEPYRASIEYLRADFHEFFERSKPKITDEAIQTYYDDNKDIMYRAFSGFDSPLPPNPDPLLPLPSNPDPVLPLPNNPDPKLPPAGDEAFKPAGQFNVQDTAAEDTPTKTPGKATAAKKSDGAEKDAKKNDTKTAGDTTAADKTPAEKKPEEKQPDDKEPGNKEPGNKEPEVKYEPLSQHRDEIIKRLAETAAAEEIERVLREIGQLEIFTKHLEKHEQWSFDNDEKQRKSDPPTRPDLKRIAEQYDLTQAVTGMLSKNEANASEGFSKEFAGSFATNRPSLFDVQTTPEGGFGYIADSDLNGFLYWKIEQKLSYTPELPEIRDKAVVAFKMEEALKLARSRADEYAQQAKDHGGQLKLVFTDDLAKQVIEPDPFTWMNSTVDMQWLQLTQQFRMMPEFNGKIEGVKYVNTKFLETIFTLKENEVGIVVDNPQQIVYVVRMSSIEDAVPSQLLTPDSLRQAREIARYEGSLVFRDWYDAIEREFKVEWK